jgi:hypothetical protein
MSQFSHTDINDCACCAGIAVQTPLALSSRPGLAALAYRVGTHATFKRSMLARLADTRWPALGRLRTREPDDFTIALIDAWAVVGDVLSFYQERIANESYLRTASERLSILEQARLIGYQLAPGLAASTHLAFTLEDSPGMPELAAKPLTLAIGTKAQSVPGPNEEAQTFETIEEITARHQWNALAAQLTEAQSLAWNITELWLEGASLNLNIGDSLLIIAAAGATKQASLRRVTKVEPDANANRTRVNLATISTAVVAVTNDKLGVWVMRTVASPFGHNAPLKPNYSGGVFQNTFSEWSLDGETDDKITLSARHEKILTGSWLVIEQDNSAGTARVWIFAKANGVSHRSLAKYGIAGNGTRLSLSTPWQIHDSATLALLRGMTIAAQSEELTIAKRPLTYPVYGAELALDARVEGLTAGRPVAITGKRQRLRITEQAVNPVLILSAGGSRLLEADDILTVAKPPAKMISGVAHALTPAEFDAVLNDSPASLLRFELIDRDGQLGTINLLPAAFNLEPAGDKDDSVSEIAFIDDDPTTAVTDDRDRTTIQLAEPLAFVYERATVRVNANVAAATHGESVKEVLGSSDATIPFQKFTLRQPPLTYVSADTPSGSTSTLKIYVNDVQWHEAPFFYGRDADEHLYVAQRDDDGKTTIQFGDGINGARLPTGQNNVRAEYRKGSGSAGLVDAKQISQLLSRPLGLKEVVNPEASHGAEDAEWRDDARKNAPLTVLTLDRAVSLQDYEDFSRTFAGVAKAQAVWVWDGRKRVVFITVAGPDGADLDEQGTVVTQLKDALKTYGDPYVAFVIKNFRKVLFQAHGTVSIDADHVPATVMAAVHDALRCAYAFEVRQFGQPVALSEVIAVIQSVAGILAVDIDNFYRNDETEPSSQARLIAKQPAMGGDGLVQSAELLLLDGSSLNQLGGVQ